jgi:hypothetical protein
MTRLRVFLSAAALVLLACGSEPRAPKPPPFGKAFSHLPLPPNPELVSRAGSADALQITFRTPVEVAQVTEYYRTVLTRGNWRLVGDIKSADGSTALYAEHDGPPLWVRIWKPADQPGTMVQLTGAVVAADSSSAKRIDSTTRRPASRRANGA